jgi:3-hydroxybutyryl-CoA dehydrogenase
MSNETRDQIMSRIVASATLEESVADISLYVEAVIEEMSVKREVFGRVSKAAPPDAILATNTSSLSVTAIASATDRPEQVAGMHFFNPAPIMRLVEVIRGDQTSDATVDKVAEIAREWGKTPAIAKDTPGFIVNRCARNFYGESLRILGENLAPVETIDRVMSGVGGFRMGPFELMDLVGIEVNFAVTKSVYQAYFGEPRFRPHPIQQKMVEAGMLGRKTGRGFYRHEQK